MVVTEQVPAHSKGPTIDGHCLTVLSDEQRIGLIFIVICSFLSLIAVLKAVAYYVRNIVRIYQSNSGVLVLLKSDIDAYFLSLLFADMLVAFGGILNLKWIIRGSTSCGGFCSAQGAFEQISTPAVALSNLAIALNTFFVIFFRWTPPRTRVIALSFLIVMWTFLLLLVLIPALSVHSGFSSRPFFTPTPAWCYVGSNHLGLRAVGYSFAWFAAFVSGIAYGLLWLKLRGTSVRRLERRGILGRLSVGMGWDHFLRDRGVGGNNSDRERRDGQDNGLEEARSMGLREAQKMLWYPLCYMIIIIPMSAARWTSFIGHESSSLNRHEVPFGITAAAASLFKLSGVVDVLLFMYTRPNILLSRFENSSSRLSARLAQHRRTGRLGSNRSLRSWLGERTRGMGTESFEREETHRRGSSMELECIRSRDGDGEPGLCGTHTRSRSEGTIANSSQTHLIPPTLPSSDMPLPIIDIGPQTSQPEAPSDRNEAEGFAIDLSDELEYYSPPVTPARSLTSPRKPPSIRTDKVNDVEVGPHRVRSFQPLTLDLPDPRMSGMSSIIGPWVEMQREEWLTFSESASKDGNVGGERLSNRASDMTSMAMKRFANIASTQPHADQSDIGGTTHPEEGEFGIPSSGVELPGGPQLPRKGKETNDGVDEFKPDHSTSLLVTDAPPDRFNLEEDPFSMFTREVILPDLPSPRNQRPRGPRPPSSAMASSTDSRKGRPIRPTIGIPSSGITTTASPAIGSANTSSSSPSPRSGHSSRIRYPYSSLASIPEHDLFHPPRTAPYSPGPHSYSPTSPLVLHDPNRQSGARPRSLSDSAGRRSRGRRSTYESERQSSNSSFIDMN